VCGAYRASRVIQNMEYKEEERIINGSNEGRQEVDEITIFTVH
jgi:hypothetical protein